MYEQRARIIYELDRATNKAAQHGAVIEQLERMKGLTGEEVKRLRGQLKAVEQEHKILSEVSLRPRHDMRSGGWCDSSSSRPDPSSSSSLHLDMT